jgi:hypothetical protein
MHQRAGRYLDWINQPAYGPIRRIDVVLALGFIGCVAYYSTFNWQSALAGGLLYIMLGMISIWLL